MKNGCLISLTTEPIWFYFTRWLLIGPGKVYNYFGEVSNNRAREITARKKINPSQIIVRRYIGRGKFVSIKFDNLDLIYW